MSTEVTSPSWALSVRMQSPLTESQKRTEASFELCEEISNDECSERGKGRTR